MLWLYNYIVTFGYLVLLGCYGDVLRVKILYNKKDSALIQFAESFQAQTGMCLCVVCLMIYCNDASFIAALLHLNGIPLHGKQLHISLSKYSSVQMPKEGSSEVYGCIICTSWTRNTSYRIHCVLCTYLTFEKYCLLLFLLV